METSVLSPWDLDVRPLEQFAEWDQDYPTTIIEDEFEGATRRKPKPRRAPAKPKKRETQPKRKIGCGTHHVCSSEVTAYTPGVLNCVRGMT
jgi:hypothetical protein